MTTTDPDLRDALAPLRAAEPTDDEIAAVLAAAEPDPPRRRRRWRLAAAVATGTAAAGVALAALPGSDDGPREPQTAASLLRSAAAVAADQPEPPAWAGYRYVKVIARWTNARLIMPKDGELPRPKDAPSVEGEPAVNETTDEVWIDRRWQGRRVRTGGRHISGPGDGGNLIQPHEWPYDGGGISIADVELSELPTDPTELKRLLVAAVKDPRWAGDHPTAAQVHHYVLLDVLRLLTVANVTAEQRAALIELLTQYEGAKPLPSVRDHLGREGRGVEIPVTVDWMAEDQAPTRVRIIFAPDTSELLEWDQDGVNPGMVRTFVRPGHVAEIGDRP